MSCVEPGTHEWVIEFEKEPAELTFFAEVLDNALKALNSDYEAKRSNNLNLRFPIVHNAPNGTFYAWLKERGKLGGQHKVPFLANNREYIESIISIMNKLRK